jgi:hypothetical protein
MSDKTTTTMIFRVDPDLKKAFEQTAKDLDLTASQLLRKMIRNAVEQHMKANAQRTLALAPIPTPQPAPTKPAKGQKMASMKPANRRKP